MPAGLQVRDASNNLIIDISSRLTRVLYSATVSAAGSHTSDEYLTGDLFYTSLPIRAVATGAGDFGARPNVSKSGNVVSWTWPGTPTGDCLIILGVY